MYNAHWNVIHAGSFDFVDLVERTLIPLVLRSVEEDESQVVARLK